MPTREEVERAVARAPRNASVIAVRGDDLRPVGNREGAGPNAPAVLVLVGPLDMRRLPGGRPPSIRPGDDGPVGSETGELAWLRPEDARRVRRERNRAEHEVGQAARAEAAQKATSAPVAPAAPASGPAQAPRHQRRPHGHRSHGDPSAGGR